MSNDEHNEATEPVDEPREERALGPGAAGDIENPAEAPRGSQPLPPVGEVGVTDDAAQADVEPTTPVPAPPVEPALTKENDHG